MSRLTEWFANTTKALAARDPDLVVFGEVGLAGGAGGWGDRLDSRSAPQRRGNRPVRQAGSAIPL